jgi:hypothetical protein
MQGQCGPAELSMMVDGDVSHFVTVVYVAVHTSASISRRGAQHKNS